MRTFRFSIARLMWVVLVSALGFAALRNPSEVWAGTLLLVTCAAILIAVVGAVCRGPGERAWWLGFALFAGGYLAAASLIISDGMMLPTIAITRRIGATLSQPKFIERPFFVQTGWEALPPDVRIVHCVWAIALGLAGCLLSGILAAGPSAEEDTPVAESEAPLPPLQPRWKQPEWIALAGFWITDVTAVVFRWPMPGLWAGAGFLVSCAMLGLAALAAVFGRKADRAAWLAAALFGFGYLGLTFGKSAFLIVAPHLPTETLINTLLRPGGPRVQSEFPDFTSSPTYVVNNEVINQKLDLVIPMKFPNATPLADLLKYLKTSTRDNRLPGLPIFVDPVGLQLAEKSMNSPVTIDLDGLPIRRSLSLCLRQLGLGYRVRYGFILISDADSIGIPVHDDPVQVVGHSLAALVAGVFGYYTILLISGRWRPRIPGRLRAPAAIDGDATP